MSKDEKRPSLGVERHIQTCNTKSSLHIYTTLLSRRKPNKFQGHPSQDPRERQDEAEDERIPQCIRPIEFSIEKYSNKLGGRAGAFCGTAIPFICFQKKLKKLASERGVDFQIIVIVHSHNHTLVHIMARTNVVGDGVEPSEELRTDDQSGKEVVNADKDAAEDDGGRGRLNQTNK